MHLKTLQNRILIAVGILCALGLGEGYLNHSGTGGARAAEEEAKPAGESGKPAEKPAHGEKGEGKGAPPKPQYQLGPSLDGHFDRSTLRSTRRIVQNRFPFICVEQALEEGDDTWVVRMDCVVEFGTSSALAEMPQYEKMVETDIRETIQGFRIRGLNTVAGKLRLKQAVIQAINRRLKTARVRQVYLTNFIILWAS